MKLHLCVFGFLMLTACQGQLYLKNQTEIDTIDRLPINETVTELELDSMGEVMDTLSLTSLKFNSAGGKIYQKYQGYQTPGITTISYYRDQEELCYQSTQFSATQDQSFFQTSFTSDGRIDKALYIFNSGEVRDTQFMEYQYDYRPDSTKKEVRILSTSTDGTGMNIDTYDVQEKLLSSVLILESDTIHIEERFYQDSLLMKIVDKSFIGAPSLSISHYNSAGKLREETSFASLEENAKPLQQTLYSYDGEGQLSGKIEESLLDGKKRYFKYLRQKKMTK